MEKIVISFIEAANAFYVERVLMLFAPDAVIDDVSVGDAFVGINGIRQYLQQFFVGYKTVSKLIALESLSKRSAIARIDFTGDFGHEIGTLKIVINAQSLIQRIDADLE